ncbi:MAG: hypothetical protein IJQ84_02290 [Paludibacteraceae bacterium]|nr:hypothetical protein [Paludibacteraceae bacterium]
MKRRFLIILLLIPLLVHAQQDSIPYRKPDAGKAVWLGAIVPGAGQIYNGSYWKLPIVYGAFMGCGYAIGWTNNRYTGYKTAYLDLYNDRKAGTVSEDPSKSYIAVIPEGYNLERVGGAARWESTLKNQQSIYRRYRDYSILATVLVYALSMIDAYVDAQLFDYDISPNLSLNIEPQIYYDLQQQQKSAELKLAIQF